MKSTVFSNNQNKPTSIRYQNGRVYQTATMGGVNKGSTMKLGRSTYRFSNTGKLISIGIKSNGKTEYFDPMGKKQAAIKPY